VSDKSLIPIERVQQSILFMRKEKVILSMDLALLYGVEHRVLMQAVKRNIDRFPSDFMFQLSPQEFSFLKSQIVTSSWGGIRKAPYAFTEQGVAMLSSVLRSPRAVHVNIEIMRIFVELRKESAVNKSLSRRLSKLEQKYDEQFTVVFDALRNLIEPSEAEKRPIGFVHQTDNESKEGKE